MKGTLTTLTVAREAGISERRVRQYADLGLIESIRDSGGRRLFSEASVEQARAAFAARTRRLRKG